MVYFMDSQEFYPALPQSIPMIDSYSEIEFLRSLSSQAVSVIYDRYFPEVFRYVRFRLMDEVLAEDVASEVFLRLLEALRVRRGPEKNLRGWLISTAHHIVTDHIRHRYRHPVEGLSDTFPGVDADPSDEVLSQENARTLRSALADLTEDQQHVLALRFGQGYSIEETADLMKKNINAIKALQFRALNALHRRIGGAEE